MSPRILLIGGHGAISLLATPKLIARSYNLVSLIRNPEQKKDILAAGSGGPGSIDVLVESLDEVKSVGEASRILELAKPDWVVWSAGAGGKGGKERTYQIDQDACINFIKASLATTTISKFLLVSALTVRPGNKSAEWWTPESVKGVEKSVASMPDYVAAKCAADQAMTSLAAERVKAGTFNYVILRPGRLANGDETGQVDMGKTQANVEVQRGDVAEVISQILAREWTSSGWVDLVGGKETIGESIDRVLANGEWSWEGEA